MSAMIDIGVQCDACGCWESAGSHTFSAARKYVKTLGWKVVRAEDRVIDLCNTCAPVGAAVAFDPTIPQCPLCGRKKCSRHKQPAV